MTLYTYPTIRAGKSLTAAMAEGIPPLFIKKGSDLDRASTTTLADDPDLTFPVSANGVYLIEWGIYYGGLSAADFKTGWNTPAGTSGLKSVRGPGSASADESNANNITGRFGVHGFTTSISYNCSRNGTGNIQAAYESGVVTIGGTPGNVTLQWAQVTSNATASRLAGASWGRCTRFA